MLVNSNKIVFIALLSFFFVLFSPAQTSVNTCGGNTSGLGGTVAFSIGQVTYKQYSTSTHIECQGVQKSSEFLNAITTPLDLGEFKISNYMSPNNDGQNDTWKISNTSVIKDCAITIVDMWGNKVFSVSNNYNNEFDGTSAGRKLLDGVYYYVISENGKTKYSGSITILK